MRSGKSGLRVFWLSGAALIAASACGETAGTSANVVTESTVSSTAEEALRSEATVWEQRRNDDPTLAAFLARLQANLTAAKIPGAGVAVVKNGRLYFAGGIGQRKAGSTEAVDAHTQFRIASVSKPLAAMTVLSVRDSGRLNLNKSVTDYAPSFKLLPPHDPSLIKVGHLISHTAGLADFYEPDCKTEGPQSIEENFAARANLTQRNPSGLFYSYSNQNFNVAALVAQKASGVPYRQLVQANIFSKAGMVDSTYEPKVVRARNNYAVGVSAGATPVDVTFSNCSLSDGAGGAYSSAHDLGRLAEQLLRGGGNVMPFTTFFEMVEPKASTQSPAYVNYGYGLFSQPYKGTAIYGHSGDLPGFHTAWFMLPQYGFAAAVVVNGDGFPPVVSVVDAFNAFNALPNIALPDTKTPPSSWQEFTGVYVDPIEPNAIPAGIELGPVQVDLENDKLMFTLLAEQPQVKRELFQNFRDSFSMRGGPGYLLNFTFHRNRSGQPHYLNDRVFGSAKRTAPQALQPIGKVFSTGEALRRLDALSTANLAFTSEVPFIPPELLEAAR
jgi:beta-lactamase class C